MASIFLCWFQYVPPCLSQLCPGGLFWGLLHSCFICGARVRAPPPPLSLLPPSSRFLSPLLDPGPFGKKQFNIFCAFVCRYLSFGWCRMKYFHGYMFSVLCIVRLNVFRISLLLGGNGWLVTLVKQCNVSIVMEPLVLWCFMRSCQLQYRPNAFLHVPLYQINVLFFLEWIRKAIEIDMS